MSEISDELRRLNNSDIVCGHTWVALQEIADRIDREMVELPKDADGEPIHVRDTVYGCRSGMKMTISELRMTADGWSIIGTSVL